MRVGLDLTALLPVETGVDRYLVELTRALARIDEHDRFALFVNLQDRARLGGGLGRNFSVVPITLRGRAGRVAGQQLVVPVLASALGLDVVHSPSFLMPWFRGSARHVLTVFDMTMVTRPLHHTRLRRSRPFRMALEASIRRADLVAVPSDHVRRELSRLLPDVPSARVRVIPLGVGAEFRPSQGGAVDRMPPGLEGVGDYILFVGTLEPRKSLGTLFEGYRRAVRAHGLQEHLVLVGRLGWGGADLEGAARSPELRGRIHRTGYVDGERLLALYRRARLFVYPSIEEGFGFPPLEAMACGVPTIVSDTSSLRENLEGAAALVPPEDPHALCEAMARVLRSPELQRRMRSDGLDRARRFNWEETARRTLACYEELAGRADAALCAGKRDG
jgi:alpha-1,3-rhamnosyl/mannosyltransferase